MQERNHSAGPFPGLRTFESSETHLFFGRDGQSEELLKRLRRTRFLAVVGTSGSGKSSLVRAGLLPALQGGLMSGAGSDWRIAVMRPGGDPIGNLARALASPAVLGPPDEKGAEMQAVLAETTLRRSSLGLVELVGRARAKLDEGGQPLFQDYENLLVVVDQFEELFRFRRHIGDDSNEDATAFVKLLLEAVRQKAEKIYVVLTMRSDFLGECSRFWGLPEAINAGQYLIPRMTRDERREAITGPVSVGQGAISEPLINLLLNDVGDNPDQLPIMQHALMRTWDYWLGHRSDGEPVDIPHYLAIGGMAEALSRHAEEAYGELSEAQKVIAERLFKGLTEKGADGREVRRPLEVREICETTGAGEAEVVAVVEVFRREGRSFLMPPPADPLTGAHVPLTEESLIDISHESLIRNWSRLTKWTDEEARSARIYLRLAETAVLHKAGKEALLKDPALHVTLDWREKNRPSAAWARRYHPEFETAETFLDASVAARDAEAREREQQRHKELRYRRTKQIASVLALSVLLSLASAVYAFRQRSAAEKQRQFAEDQRGIAEQKTAEARAQSQRAEEASKDATSQRELAEAASVEAKKQRELALAEKKIADEQRARAERGEREALTEAVRTNQLLYSADLNLAQQAYDSGNIERARELLNGQISSKGVSPGFEWFYLSHLLRNEKETEKSPGEGFILIVTSPDGKTRVVGAGNKLELRRLDTGETKSAALPEDFLIGSLAISADGKVLAVGSGQDCQGPTVVLFGTGSLNKLSAFRESTEAANSLAFASDKLIVGGGSGSVSLWGLDPPRKLTELRLPGTINVAASPDGEMFATGSSSNSKGGMVQVWSTSMSGGAEAKPLQRLWGHGDVVAALAFSPKHKTLATGSMDKTIRLWDTEDWKLLSVLSFTSRVFSLAYSPGGDLLAMGFEDGSIRLCETETFQGCATLRGHHEAVIALAFSAGGELLFTSDCKYVPSTDGSIVFEPNDDDTRIKTWDVVTLAREQIPIRVVDRAIRQVVFSHDGKTLAVLSKYQTGGRERTDIRLLDVETNEWLKPLIESKLQLTSVAFSPDDRLIATADLETVRLWDASTREPVGEPLRHGGLGSHLAFSPDGKLLAAGQSDGSVKMWDTASRRLVVETPGGKDGGAVSVSFPPDGKSFSFYRDGHVESRDRNLGTLLRRTKIQGSVANPGGMTALSPNGKVFAESYDDGRVMLYSAGTGKRLGVLKVQEHDAPSIAFSADSRLLVIGGNHGAVKLWDTTSLRESVTLRDSPLEITSAAFSPDGKKLATVNAGSQLRVWHAPAGDVEAAARR